MDRELAAELKRRGIPSVDNSANLNAWNSTCLQRHIGRVRHERLLGLAALVAAGLDVLHTVMREVKLSYSDLFLTDLEQFSLLVAALVKICPHRS